MLTTAIIIAQSVTSRNFITTLLDDGYSYHSVTKGNLKKCMRRVFLFFFSLYPLIVQGAFLPSWASCSAWRCLSSAGTSLSVRPVIKRGEIRLERVETPHTLMFVCFLVFSCFLL